MKCRIAFCLELAPYKYAGYTQLIKTIRLETEDDALFSKTVPLLAAATELCYYTLACSALNAEQLRRENGLEVRAVVVQVEATRTVCFQVLQEAFSRCVSVITQSAKPDDLAVQVCYYVCRCYATAAQFPACREKLAELSQLFSDLCRVVRFKVRPGFRTLWRLSKGSSVSSTWSNCVQSAPNAFVACPSAASCKRSSSIAVFYGRYCLTCSNTTTLWTKVVCRRRRRRIYRYGTLAWFLSRSYKIFGVPCSNCRTLWPRSAARRALVWADTFENVHSTTQ